MTGELAPLGNMFLTLVRAGQGVALAVAAAMLMWAGFLFMTSGGSPGRIEQSKSAAFNAAIGLLIVLGAQVIANAFGSLFRGMGGG